MTKQQQALARIAIRQELSIVQSYVVGLDPRDDFIHVLHTATQIEQAAARMLQEGVELARAQGYTWAAIGHHLGITRQAAQQRFGSID